MSNSKYAGCGLAIILISIVMTTLLAVSNDHNAGGVIGIVPTSITSAQLVLTADTSSAEANMPFAVEHNLITFQYKKTLDYPCNYIIAGHVLDIDGKPFTNYLVNIHMINDEAPVDEIGKVRPYSETDFDSYGFELLLTSWEGLYEIWLTSSLHGETISPHVVVFPQDCDHNVAIVNFVQVRLLN